MPFYDTLYNRVLVTVTVPEQVQAVHAYLRDRRNSVHMPEPDEPCRMSIGIHQAANIDAAVGIKQCLDLEWSASAASIDGEPTNRSL